MAQKDSLMVDLRSVQDRAAKGTPMAPRGATSRIVQVPMQTVQVRMPRTHRARTCSEDESGASNRHATPTGWM